MAVEPKTVRETNLVIASVEERIAETLLGTYGLLTALVGGAFALIGGHHERLCDHHHRLASGIDPAAPIVMHVGLLHDGLHATVGVAAGLTVTDSGGKPRLGD
jgi:hypothetical protein